jgi:Zn-finger nucleic acid-binding protein
MNCPKCNHTLTSRSEDQIEIDECPNCGGVWFDLGELKAVLGNEANFSFAGANSATPILDQLSGPCPRCGGTGHMTRLTHLARPDVIMDSCAVCYGIWLDGGEVNRLAERGLGSSLREFAQRLFGV